ncbi:MAG: glycosyltransferase family 9 protein [Uliginosibacterium sp.]|jgi:heptosyltransferase-3|nr:glycosyltransferase family 9 protein [Uliginosibacterium sp.]
MHILIIRRDNIGDLVCTLPLVRRLRECYPDAWIGMLVTRYNAEVLQGNPDINAVFSYTKRKHLAPGESAWAAMLARLRQLWQLRRRKLDLVLLPAEGDQRSARRMARLVAARQIVSHEDLRTPGAPAHEVVRASRLLQVLELPSANLPPASIRPDAVLRREMLGRIGTDEAPVLGIHISARKPSQRWPEASFVALIKALHARQPQLRFALFWSPGDENNPLHPGDDGKASRILAACAGLPVVPLRTASLAELIAGLSCCERLLCADGGHMHLGAALGKPIVCLFGKSDASRWHPWGVPFRLLQPASQDVAEVSAEAVIAAFDELSAAG